MTSEINIDFASLWIPTASQVVEGFAVAQGYQALIDVTWDRARKCVEAESRWLAHAAQAPTPNEFDRVLSTAAEEETSHDSA